MDKIYGTNPHDAAYPQCGQFPLTKREVLAALIMNGVLAGGNLKMEYGDNGRTRDMYPNEIAGWAVELTDALIAELNKEKEVQNG